MNTRQIRSQAAMNVNSTSSKADEITHLEAFAATCEPGSYLAQLLTPDFIKHVKQTIVDDGCMDLLGTTNYLREQGSVAYSKELAAEQRADGYQKQVAGLYDQIDDLKKNAQDAEIAWQNVVAEKSAEIERLNWIIENHEKTIAVVRQEIGEALIDERPIDADTIRRAVKR